MLAHTYACAYKDTHTQNIPKVSHQLFLCKVRYVHRWGCAEMTVLTLKRPPLASISSHYQQVQSSPQEWSYQLKAGKVVAMWQDCSPFIHPFIYFLSNYTIQSSFLS